MPVVRTDREKHLLTHANVVRALAAVKQAIKNQDGLEWTGRLEEVQRELEDIEQRIKPYFGGAS